MKKVVCFFLLSLSINCFVKAQSKKDNCDLFSNPFKCSFGQYFNYEHGDWELVFEDDFNDASIDRNKWFTCIYGWNREHGDDELQYYLDENVILENGLLKLTAQRQPGFYDVWCFNDEGADVTSKFFEYTSGWIQTKSNFKYGLFEVKCKIPNGYGFWPAFWLFGNGEEIDIFEFASNKQDVYLTTLHKWYDDGGHEYCPDNSKYTNSFADDYHIFSLEWDEFILIFRVDGIIKRVVYKYYDIYNVNINVNNYYSTDNEHFYIDYLLFPENPQSLILNLAIPHKNSDFGDNSSNEQMILPASLDIDYVRVYKKNNPSRDIFIDSYYASKDNYYTGNTISVAGDSNVIVSDNETLVLFACNNIVLNNGFEAKEGSFFYATMPSNLIGDESNTKNSDSVINNDYMETDKNRGHDNFLSVKSDSTKNNVLNTDDVLNIYPNPSNDYFCIDLSGCTTIYKHINIFDIYGNLINCIDNPKDQLYTIDFIRKKGLYVIELISYDMVKYEKILIK